ncbi:MAG: hypothetical protein WA830_25070 [Candidatus Sulfotelmatobacter sp.]
MLAGTQDQEIIDSLPRLSELYTTYGVQVNAISVGELFALYERTGFLYPDKAARLTPHIEQVRENWRRMFRGGESLLYVLTAGDEERGRASLAVWRTTHQGWTPQHLVSEGNPYASRAVMLAGSAASILKGVDESHQNWFRPENRFPTRVFGSMVQTIGESYSSVQRHAYFSLPRRMSLTSGGAIRTVAYNSSHKAALCAVASAARGRIYVAAEELAGDVEFKAVDELYRRVGLRRTRHVWLAYKGNKEEPVGAAIAYRGPLGLNFSYLENRCDLLLHPTLPESEALGVVSSLLKASSVAYRDFELDVIPVITDQIAVPAMLKLGIEFVRHYCQGIWLKEGNPGFYRHVDRFYSKLLVRVEKHGLQPSLTI